MPEILNPDGLPPEIIEQAIAVTRNWQQTRPYTMFDRGVFTQPDNRTKELASVQYALLDPTVSLALDHLEGLAFRNISVESPDQVTAALFDELFVASDVSTFARRAFRELLTYGLFTTASWITTRSFTIPYKTASQTRRRSFSVTFPEKLSILDVTRVVPLSLDPWGNKALFFQKTLGENLGTDTSQRLFATERPMLSMEQQEALRIAGSSNPDLLAQLNPATVWQHSVTTPDYILYPTPPLRRVLPLLEMKARLQDADRAALVGSANYFLVVKVGSEDQPPLDGEKELYREGLKRLAKYPVLIGDHRLSVEILSPPTDNVLIPDRHQLLEGAIYGTILGLPPGILTNDLDQEIVANLVCGRINAMRSSVADAINKYYVDPIRRSTGISDSVKILFNPRNLTIYDVNMVTQSILAARQRRDLSRETYLAVLGYDQASEAAKVEAESETYDDIFKSDQQEAVPTANNSGMPPGAYGSTGGKPRNSQLQTRKRARTSNE